MKTYLLAVTLVASAVATGLDSNAKACDGFGNGYGYWSGWGAGYLYDSLQYNVPYFAAFPPVYYSYPVPRTYGYSPFAYPPGVMTPDVVGQVAPAEIINPYVPSSQDNEAAPAEDQQTSARKTPEPLVINNPFYTQDRSVAQVQR